MCNTESSTGGRSENLRAVAQRHIRPFEGKVCALYGASKICEAGVCTLGSTGPGVNSFFYMKKCTNDFYHGIIIIIFTVNHLLLTYFYFLHHSFPVRTKNILSYMRTKRIMP